MTWIDYVIISLLGIAIILAIISIYKNRGKGCSSCNNIVCKKNRCGKR